MTLEQHEKARDTVSIIKQLKRDVYALEERIEKLKSSPISYLSVNIEYSTHSTLGDKFTISLHKRHIISTLRDRIYDLQVELKHSEIALSKI